MRKFAVIGALLLSLGCATTGDFPTPEQEVSGDFGECPPNYEQTITLMLKRTLYDPYSAVIKMTDPIHYIYQGQKGHVVVVGCNAKNRFGGYVGIKYFYYMCFPDGHIEEIPNQRFPYFK